jgi:cold shock protein
VAGGGFADCEYKGRKYRFWSDFVAERPIRIDRDPTSDLIAVAREWAEDRLLNLQGDLLHGGDTELTRWDIFAAPFMVELSEKLRARLKDTWKGNEPQRLPGEAEPYPLPPQFAQGVPATVEQWHEDDGWGVLTSDQVPKPMRFESSAIETEGERTLAPGQLVEVDVEGPVDEDEFPYRAWRVVPFREGTTG